MPQRLLREGPTPVVNRDPRPINDVQTEPLEMMGGSGLVSVPLSVPIELSKPSISTNIMKVDPVTASSSSLPTNDFSTISHGVL